MKNFDVFLIISFVILKILMVAFNVFAFVENWSGSQLGTHNYNLELLVIEEGKNDYLEASRRDFPEKDLLCVSFVYASISTAHIMLKNVEIMKNNCDWAFIFYGGSNDFINEFCGQSSIKAHAIYCKRTISINEKRSIKVTSRNGANFSIPFPIPKTVMYHDLLPFLTNYNRAFLMDQDIYLQGFNITLFQNAWDCSFDIPPLIVQPVIAESTQYIYWANAKPWRHPKFKHIIANEVGLVEQQVPFFNTLFLEWFIKRILTRTKEVAYHYGADWGHDRSWCNAAKLYSSMVLNRPNNTVVCAIFPQASSVHHLNTHSIQSKKYNRTLFKESAKAVVQHYIDLFPTWVITDAFRPNNPFDPKNAHKFIQKTSFASNCLSK